MVYVDTQGEKRVVEIRPKAAFGPVFQVATTREGSGVTLVKEKPPADGPEDAIPAPAASEADAQRCSWWRRGSPELPLLKNIPSLLVSQKALGVGLK